MHIQARELCVGDQIMLNSGKTILVKSLEYGRTCHGVHVNAIRDERATITVRAGKCDINIPNPTRNQLKHCHGCYHMAAPISVIRGY